MAHPTPEQLDYMRAHASDDKRLGFVIMNASFLGLACGAVALRFMARHRVGTKIGMDDVLICFALLFLAGHAIGLFVAVHFGMGRHAIFVTNVKGLALTSIIAQAFYNVGIPAIKLSILALYARIFRRTTGWFTPTLYATAIFVASYSITQLLVYIFRCMPISAQWDPTKEGTAKCLNFKAIIIVFGIINIVTDWFILVLPIPVVLGLRMERRTKWSLLGLFFWGGLVCIVSIIRLLYAKNTNTVDPSWDFVPIAQISTVETASGILAASMPTYRPLFKFFGNGITSLFSSNRGGKSSQSRSAPGSDLMYALDSIPNTGNKEKRSSQLAFGKRRSKLVPHPQFAGDLGVSGLNSGVGLAEGVQRAGSEERILGREWEVSAGKSSDEIDAELGVQVGRGSRAWEDFGGKKKETKGIVVTKTISTVTGQAEKK